MSNITIVCICFTILSVCLVVGGIVLIIIEVHDRKVEKFDKLMDKLHQLNNTPECGPRFNSTHYISVEWLLNYIKGL